MGPSIYLALVNLLSLGASVAIFNIREIFIQFVTRAFPSAVAKILYGASFLAFGLVGISFMYSIIHGFYLGVSLFYSISRVVSAKYIGFLVYGICSSFFLGPAYYLNQQLDQISFTPVNLVLNWIAFTCGVVGCLISFVKEKRN